MIFSLAEEHFYKRKRIHQRHEPYPHPVRWKRIIDRVIYIAAFIGPLLTLPQVLKIWIGKSAIGVSIISWSFFLLLAFIWLIYGIAHKSKLLIFNNILWMLMDFLIILGVIVYG
ncbi:MAG: hypothetical protein IIA87_01040 [Nanoarchaeota archaeon]|nr:hypothetical protein [Nanoarchaeota archaeon]